MFKIGDTVIPNIGELKGLRCIVLREPLSYSPTYMIKPMHSTSNYVYFFREEHFELRWLEAEVVNV